MPPKLDNSLIGRLREYIITTWNIQESVLVSWCSVAGLALLFGGIWLGDSQVDAAIESNYSTLVMRIFSFLIYAVFFLVVIKRTKDPNFNIRHFFTIWICVSLICLVAGFAVFVWAVDFLPAGQGSHGLLWFCFFLSKVIGAPVTIALVCVFSQLRRKLTFRLSIMGILSAFVIYSCISQMFMPDVPFSQEKLLIATALMALSCLCAALGLNKNFFAGGVRSQQELVEQHVIKRPTNQILTHGTFLMVMFSAITLGYLRSGFIGTDAHLQPACIVVLLIVIIISLLHGGLRIEHIFNFALLCTACSILLRPFLATVSPVSVTLLVNTGTALFEVIVWCWAVWVARNAQDSLVAATAIRTATVTGHLIGTLLVAAALLVSDANDVADTAGMLVILIFLVQTVIITHSSATAPLVMTVEEDTDEVFLSPLIHDVRSDVANDPHSETPKISSSTPSSNTAREEFAEQSTTQPAPSKNVGTKSAPIPEGDSAHQKTEDQEAQSTNVVSSTQANSEAATAPASTTATPNHDAAASPTADIENFEEMYWTKPLNTVADAYRLTRREREVLGLLARGHSFACMEDELCISHNTMKMHARNIYTKLEVHSRQDVISMVETARKQLASNN